MAGAAGSGTSYASRPPLPLQRALLLCGLCAPFAVRAQFSIDVQDYEAEAQRIRAASRTAARWDLNGVVEAKWCLQDDSGHCRWGSYVTSIFAASLSSFIFFVVFTVFACCCCCNPHQLCFRWRPTPGLPCCPGDEHLFRGYRQSQVNTARLFLLVSLALVALSSTAGWDGGPNIDYGVEQLALTMARTAAHVRTSGSAAEDELVNAVERQKERSPVRFPVEVDRVALGRDAERLSVGLDRVQRVVVHLNMARSAALVVALVLPVVTILAGLIAAVLLLGPTVGAWGAATCVAMVLLWFMLLIHSPLTPVFCDLCDHVDRVLAADAVSDADAFAGCTAGTTFAALSTVASAAEQHSRAVACAALGGLARAGDADVDHFACDTDGLEDAMDNLRVVNCGELVNATLTECARRCEVANLTSTCSPYEPLVRPDMITDACGAACRASVVYDAVEAFREYRRVSNKELQPLMQCHFVRDAYRQVYNAMCVRLIVGLNSASTASTTMGATVIIAVLVLTPLCKFFRKENQFRYRRYGLHTATYVRARRAEAQADAADRALLITLARARTRSDASTADRGDEEYGDPRR